MRNAKCSNCGAVATPGDVSNISMEQHRRFENERLWDELRRVDDLAHKFLGKPFSSLAETVPPMISKCELDLGSVGRNGFNCLNSMDRAGFLNNSQVYEFVTPHISRGTTCIPSRQNGPT
ncbi:homeobox-leucine zipper protein ANTHOCYANINLESS 2-like [Forsythia ovata]|uniref:Homeobox-leucine zipper protein ANTHOCYANINLESS 2-like n=1 Tax=Forsythia ovata TaxID=205694 RepID=A0ABD1WL11_9LAMI